MDLMNSSTVTPALDNFCRKILILFSLIMLIMPLVAQKDQVLFEINGEPVLTPEFQYIYEKNNRDKADYSKESLEEYLDLYINFKLKVRKAKDLGYADTDAYKEELEGYRKQLADSYVIDREVVDKIINEIYDRKQYDLRLSHILIVDNGNSGSAQTKEALETIQAIEKEIQDGLDFEEAAGRHSQDRNSAQLGGDIGYLTAALPDGFFELENAVYNLNVGEISGIVKTGLGFHLVKVVDRRPARGTMEAAHILIKEKKGDFATAGLRDRLESLRQKILSGEMTWEDAVKTGSQDMRTKSKAGNLGYFGIGQYESSFEDAAFSISEDGGISEPVLTSLGWHIIKRLNKKAPADRVTIKEQVRSLMHQGLRFEHAKSEVVQKLKKDGNFNERTEYLQIFRDSIGDDFFDYSWQVPDFKNIRLFTFGDQKAGLSEFAEFAKRSSKTRLRAKGSKKISEVITELYNDFVSDRAIEYAESQLEERYPDFKNLMREYEEGILLFEITKDNVWDKAASDSLGLQDFYNRNSKNYKWRPRAKVTHYSVRTSDPNRIHPFFSSAKTMDAKQMDEKFNIGDTEILMYTEDVLEAGAEPLRGMHWEPGTVSAPKINNELRMTTFKKIEEVMPAGPKTLRDARGYVISDYQDELEKEWVKQLRDEYKVLVKRKALKNLIQS